MNKLRKKLRNNLKNKLRNGHSNTFVIHVVINVKNRLVVCLCLCLCFGDGHRGVRNSFVDLKSGAGGISGINLLIGGT